MNTGLAGIACMVLTFVTFAEPGQTADDESQIRAIAANWEQAWNRHDMKAMALLFTEDADFVNVAGRHWKGRREIEAQHRDRLSQFKDSTWTTRGVGVQFVRPDIALVHVEWGIRGDTDPDGTARKPREGVFSWLVIKQGGHWQIRAAQNTNVNNPPIVSK